MHTNKVRPPGFEPDTSIVPAVRVTYEVRPPGFEPGIASLGSWRPNQLDDDRANKWSTLHFSFLIHES